MNSEIVEQSFTRSIKALDHVFDFTNEFALSHTLNDKIRYVLDLAVEEFFTNMVKYNSRSSLDITLGIQKSGDSLRIRLTDYNVDRFDITQVKEPQLDLSLRERKVGGLGLYLTKKVIDRIDYQYENRNSIVTLIKKLES